MLLQSWWSLGCILVLRVGDHGFNAGPNLKTLKLIVAASPPHIQYFRDRMKTDWLKVRIVSPCELACLSVGLCFCGLAQKRFGSAWWTCTKQDLGLFDQSFLSRNASNM